MNASVALRVLTTGLPPREGGAPLHPDLRVVSIIQAEFPLSGRNGHEPRPLRPDSFVDKYVDKLWTPCVWMGMT